MANMGLSALQANNVTVVRMANMGLSALQANNVTDFNDIRLGFHVPPQISVLHLHLHVLAPRSGMYEDAIERCLTGSYWFLTRSDS
ncbi:adenosine 5'-monophosphoramidase HINT3-like isoform X2 [Alosa pseudoharengus]|uniref:adenosine 5'-monophosphoramidase HINT3-like isoform X2 n=1 Tax=Alosa pseudoharengus TaxID=34774 RepID=UPI003F895D16